MKYLWKAVALVGSELVLVVVVEVIVPDRFITQIASVASLEPTELLMVLLGLLFVFFLTWAIWADRAKLLAIAGGYRLRRLIPLIDTLTLAKEQTRSNADAYNITHQFVAKELTEKLEALRIPCPDLTVKYQHVFPDRQGTGFLTSMAFLKRLRFYCVDGDLKGAREHGAQMKRIAERHGADQHDVL